MSFPLFFTLFRGLSPCLALRSNLLYLDLPVLVVCLNCVRVLYVWLKLGGSALTSSLCVKVLLFCLYLLLKRTWYILGIYFSTD